MTSPDCFVISLVKNHLEIRNKVRVAPLCIRDGLKHAKEKVGKLILTANFYTSAIHVTKSLTILAKNLRMHCNIAVSRLYCTANCTQAHHCKPFWYILWSDFFAHLLTVVADTRCGVSAQKFPLFGWLGASCGLMVLRAAARSDTSTI